MRPSDERKPREVMEVVMDRGLKRRAGGVFRRMVLSHQQAIALFFEEVAQRGALLFAIKPPAGEGAKPDEP